MGVAAVQTLERFVPVLARRLIGQLDVDGAGTAVWNADAAILVVDISGYTVLTERASRAGPAAVERLNLALIDLLSKLIDTISASGGDVVAFAGDAVFAVFPNEARAPDEAVLRAAGCAIHARGLIRVGEDADGAIADCRITIVTGSVWLAVIGHRSLRVWTVAGGDAFASLARFPGRQQPGEIAVDEPARQMLGTRARLRRDAELNILLALEPGCVPSDRPLATPDHARSPAMRGCLPAGLAHRLEQGRGDWLAEMRHVHAIFLSPQLGDGPSPSPHRLASAAAVAQEVLARFGGDLLQLRADENGVVMVAVFGIPGCTHEDDHVRAPAAAGALQQAWSAMGIDTDAGLASGQALCAVYGTAHRQDYVIMGEAMNLAARLMQCRAGVLVERGLAMRGRSSVEWTERRTLHLKGISRPVQAVALKGRSTFERFGPHLEHASGSRPPLVGRESELAALGEFLERASRAVAGDEVMLLIEGEAGIGKSILLQRLLGRAAQAGITVRVAGAQSIESRTPYFVWRELLQQLLDDGASPPSRQRSTQGVERALANDPELRSFASLLCEILPLDIERGALVDRMQASARASMLERLLVRLLSAGSGPPFLLVVEDAHWMDSASWSALSQVCRQVDALRLVLTYRPETSGWPDEGHQFLARHRSQVLRLAGLDDQEIVQVVQARWGGQPVPESALSHIRARCGGNPFFAEELALSVKEGEPSGDDMVAGRRRELPITVRAAVLERVDRLTVGQQQLLKIASVFGISAPLAAVVEMAGDLFDAVHVPTELGVIASRLIADLDEEADGSALRFRHAITQESVYAILTPSQRTRLHRSAALWYERVHAAEPGPWLPLLAHHFQQASIGDKAMHYLVRAGEQALQAHANAEAAQFLDDARTLEAGQEVSTFELSRRRRLLAEAHLKLSRLAACRQALLDALEIDGEPVPARRMAMAWQVILALPAGLAAPRRRARSDVANDARALLRAQVHQLRAEVAYFEHDTLNLVHSMLAGLVAARRSGPSREQAITHGTAAIVLGMLRLGGVSARHRRAALDVASAVDHEPTAAYVQHLASVCASAVGDWYEAERSIELAAEGYRRAGDLYRWQSTRMMLAYQALHLGDLPRVDRHVSEVDERQLFPAGPTQVRAWFRAVQLARAVEACAGEGAAAVGLPDTRLIDDVMALADQVDPSQALLCHGFAARALWLHGRRQAATAQAVQGLSVLARHRPTTYYSLFAVLAIGETFACAAEAGEGASPDPLHQARRVLGALALFAAIIPIGRPCERLLRGRVAQLDGRADRAARLFRQAASHADRLGMRGIEATARRCGARLAPERVWFDPRQTKGMP